MANMFSVYVDGTDTFFYCGRTLTFGNIENLNKKYITKHTWKDEDTWYKLSNSYYENSKLWWIICRANNVKNPLIFPDVGTIINIPNMSIVNNILNQISI